MNRSLFLSLLLILTSNTTYASVVKGYDQKSSCDLYRVIKTDTKIQKKLSEEIVFAKEVYGLSFLDMDVDFDNREVSIQPIMNIILGFNRNLTSSRVTISPERKDFKFLINQLNRKAGLFEKICIRDGKVVYALPFPEPSDTQTIR